MKPALITTHPIAALATPPGIAGIAVIRASGTGIVARVLPLLRAGDLAPLPAEALPPSRLRRCVLYDPHLEMVLDQIMAVSFPAPHSYTGEDQLELHCHGSPPVIERALQLLGEVGVRLAAPGEFTRRAVMNGKLDLTQAEALQLHLHATNLRTVRESVHQLSGALTRQARELKTAVTFTLAHLEANLDFAEEDIAPVAMATVLEPLLRAQQQVAAMLERVASAATVRDGWKVVICGRPNVGKSSLFNALAGRDKAIVTPEPGTTRDCNEHFLTLSGVGVVLVDTAGIRPSDHPVERLGIERSREWLREADLVLLVMDGSQPLAAADRELWAEVAGCAPVVVFNKMDLAEDPNTPPPLPPELAAVAQARVAALTGWGVPELRRLLEQRLATTGTTTQEAPMLFSVRQQQLFERIAARLQSAQKMIATHAPWEIATLELRRILAELAELTGESSPDAVLDVIFSRFCVGK